MELNCTGCDCLLCGLPLAVDEQIQSACMAADLTEAAPLQPKALSSQDNAVLTIAIISYDTTVCIAGCTHDAIGPL